MFVNFNILNQLGSPAINSNTFANRPAAGQTGRLFVSTDTYEIYRDNGTSWDLIGGPGSSTITGTGTATQVAYFTSSQAIGSSANLFWDNTSGFLGVATATPTARIEAVKTDGIGIYANFTTNAGSGSSTTALWAKNVTNSSGFAAVIEETTPNATAGQYPLLIKHSLSSGTAGVGMGTGVHWQLPDDAGTFKTTQLTIETINAAAATYATRYRFNVQNNGSSTPVAYINATGLGIFTATPGAALDIHSTGVIAQFNTTSATGNTYVSFQRTGTGVWRIGDTYNSGANFFGLFNNSISTNAIAVLAATNKTEFTAVENYTTGLARGNYFDYNLNVPVGGSFSSPNAITALTATLDLTLAGSATIPSGARSGLDAYNSIAFTGGGGTLTHNQGTQIRAYSNLTAGWAFNGSAVGTITHLAGLRALFPDNSGSTVNVTNNYALLLNDQTANTGTVTYTNRWGVYQEGASDLNYMAANLLLGSTTNSGERLQVTGTSKFTGSSFDFFTSSGLGSSGASGLMRVVTSGTGTGIAVGQADRTRYSAIAANEYTIFSDDFFLRTNGAFPLSIGTNNTARLTIIGTGQVGISTNAPSGLLQLNGVLSTPSDAANLTIKQSGTTYTDGIYLERTGERNGYYMYIGGAVDSLNFRRNYFGTQSDVMSLTRDGLVGIGTSTPGNKLTVNGEIAILGGNSIFFNNSVNSANSSITCQGGGSMSLRSYGTEMIGLIENTNMLFSTGGSERMRVTSGGNVLIGTSTDGGAKLSVNGATSINTTTNGTYSKLIVAGAIHCDNNTDASTLNQNAYGNFYGKRSTVIGGAGATTIKPAMGSESSIVVVNGIEAVTGARFADILLFMGAATTAPVVINSINYLTPAIRTYTNSGETLQLSLTGIASYSVFVTGMGSNESI